MKKWLIRISVAVTTLIFAGCFEKDTLSGYYDLYLNNDKNPIGAYKFYLDGRCYYYKYNRSTGERYPFVTEDVIEYNHWCCIGDSITIRGYSYKIRKYVYDTIELYNAKGQSETLIKSKNQW